MQISHDYFENAMAHFTATIYNAIKARPVQLSTGVCISHGMDPGCDSAAS